MPKVNILLNFLQADVGRDYGVGLIKKIILIGKFIRNKKRIPTASSWYEHLVMAETILRWPKPKPGIVVECGSYKGGSTANLSLVCKLTGRQLYIFDSFSGLPKPSASEKKHHCPQIGEIHTYTKGAFTGRLREVKSNLTKFGNLSVCSFVPGYFSATLPKFIRLHHEKIIFTFADVDLVTSLKTCLKYLWPRLSPGGYFYTHEAHHLEIAALFYDRNWWRKNLHQSIPGLIGIPFSALGYAIKQPRGYKVKPQIT